MKLILASTSPHRMKLLTEANIPFTAKAPLDDEEQHKKNVAHLPITQQALELARIKARKLSQENPESLVLGGDQICALNTQTGEIAINKPSTEAEIIEQLVLLSNQNMYLRTAISLMKNGEEVWHTVESPAVHYKSITTQKAQAVLKKCIELDCNPVGCAGAFRLESPNKDDIIASISGETPTIIGLPLTALCAYLKENNITITG